MSGCHWPADVGERCREAKETVYSDTQSQSCRSHWEQGVVYVGGMICSIMGKHIQEQKSTRQVPMYNAYLGEPHTFLLWVYLLWNRLEWNVQIWVLPGFGPLSEVDSISTTLYCYIAMARSSAYIKMLPFIRVSSLGYTLKRKRAKTLPCGILLVRWSGVIRVDKCINYKVV